ncbi:MAG: GntR family transcriptional regulator [Deltaproteobacteria bacterium]|nr:GntR family transcriptional regulator [Deltaproteobacteria bacterium]
MSIPIGRYSTLEVMREAEAGVYLGRDGEELLLPNRVVPEGIELGQTLRVFVYKDSEDRPIATTKEPKAVVGDFALLEVVDLSPHGAFLDWGLDKDLFAPFKEQHRRLVLGERLVFAVSLDERTDRVIASSQLRTFFDYDVSEVQADDEVELLVYDHNELGALVVVDGRHTGLVYRGEASRELRVGDELSGYVKLVRPDNKLDIRLQRTGRDAIDDATQALLDALREAGGFLPLHDKSPPEEIRARLSLSKKAFKRALGGLYKARRVELRPDGVKLRDEG